MKFLEWCWLHHLSIYLAVYFLFGKCRFNFSLIKNVYVFHLQVTKTLRLFRSNQMRCVPEITACNFKTANSNKLINRKARKRKFLVLNSFENECLINGLIEWNAIMLIVFGFFKVHFYLCICVFHLVSVLYKYTLSEYIYMSMYMCKFMCMSAKTRYIDIFHTFDFI